ncbi:MAG TPA: hypothetical protein VIV60_26390, partial [Polyangiaceae bacterium]
GPIDQARGTAPLRRAGETDGGEVFTQCSSRGNRACGGRACVAIAARAIAARDIGTADAGPDVALAVPETPTKLFCGTRSGSTASRWAGKTPPAGCGAARGLRA